MSVDVCRSPLHFAACCNNVEMVRLLVSCGASILLRTTDDHETPGQKCDRNLPGYDECSEFLLGKYILHLERLGSVMVRAFDLRLRGREFDPGPWRYQVTDLSCSRPCASVTKQYNLVPANGW